MKVLMEKNKVTGENNLNTESKTKRKELSCYISSLT